MPKNLLEHWVVDLGGGFELSPRGDSMHSIERDRPLIVAKWRINQTSLCSGSCPAYEQLVCQGCGCGEMMF